MMTITDVQWVGERTDGVGVKEYSITCDCGAKQHVGAPMNEAGERRQVRCLRCGASERLHRIPRGAA